MAFLGLQVPIIIYEILNAHGRLLKVLNNNSFIFFHLVPMVVYQPKKV